MKVSTAPKKKEKESSVNCFEQADRMGGDNTQQPPWSGWHVIHPSVQGLFVRTQQQHVCTLEKFSATAAFTSPTVASGVTSIVKGRPRAEYFGAAEIVSTTILKRTEAKREREEEEGVAGK